LDLDCFCLLVDAVLVEDQLVEEILSLEVGLFVVEVEVEAVDYQTEKGMGVALVDLLVV